MGGIMGMMPGMGKMKDQIAAANLDDRCSAPAGIISSMTKAERANPTFSNTAQERIAAGSGTDAARSPVLERYRQMADMMKAMGGKRGRRHDAPDGRQRRGQMGLARVWHARPSSTDPRQLGPAGRGRRSRRHTPWGFRRPPAGSKGLPACLAHEAARAWRPGGLPGLGKKK